MDSVYRRERYLKNPLVEVIFQLRFPTILNINSQPPVEFQERIREYYPFYTEQTENQEEYVISPQLGPQITNRSNSKNHNFISADKKYKINLTPSFISIPTKDYTQWEDFRSHIERVIPIFEEIYKPSFYIRIGLRYVDIINREELGLSGSSWNELINPQLLGMMTPEHESGTKSFKSQIDYTTDYINILSRAHFELVTVNDNKDLSFLIDCDYYSMEMTKLADMKDVAENLHNASTNVFRNSISEKLRVAMEPTEI